VRASGGILALALTTIYPAVSLAIPVSPARWLAALTLLVMMFGASAMRRLTDAGPWYGLAYPLGALVLMYVILRSAWRAYRQNGIIWRGTFYPLDKLRKGVV